MAAVDLDEFERLLAEGEAEPVEGWDFSWFDGRATEERPSWGYSRLLADRLSAAEIALDLQTGGGEVLAEAAGDGTRLVATEGWPPNAAIAAQCLRRLGGTVVLAAEDGLLPFRDRSFDLVTGRHLIVEPWPEIARVLRPGGTFLTQGVGSGTNRELYEFFLGPQRGDDRSDDAAADRAADKARAAGLEVLDVRHERLRVVFHDVGAVVYFLRKVVWTVPDFTVAKYRPRLAELHRKIVVEGSFVSHSRRYLIEARRVSGRS
ncbi:class I SAM-dependent methyltransferase [Amycolatopsis magusensis]|uniref:class I SAM-dependent methyltransferase n=1 Tax=Amycolatopsis magusensis TaxID=882444 RepID=UPI0024A8CABB|nr:class I SAM-dependent methyltransferase [Amycolatopsis magusensis]MDI5978949.1 class I SAM-dependent methyltransferase [Amycolatopsis magusensis]